MRIDFLGLQAFLSIAERGSFQRAAGHLNLSQTALSHRMKKLEEDLGVKLLSRTTRQVSLTKAGLELLPRARRALDELEAGVEDLRRQGVHRQQQLAIACLPTIAATDLPPILREFAAAHRDVAVRVFDNSATEIGELVHGETVEFGVTLVTASSFDLDIEVLFKEPFVLACAADHPLAGRPSVAWSDLEPYPLIRVSQRTGNRMIVDDALGARRERLKWRYEVQHNATAVSLVAAGVGIAVLPRLAIDPETTAGVAVRPLRNPQVTRTLGVITKRGVPLSPLAATLRSLIVRRLNQRRRAD